MRVKPSELWGTPLGQYKATVFEKDDTRPQRPSEAAHYESLFAASNPWRCQARPSERLSSLTANCPDPYW
jgi:hypothetical protein